MKYLIPFVLFLGGCTTPVNKNGVPIQTDVVRAKCIVKIVGQTILSAKGCARLNI